MGNSLFELVFDKGILIILIIVAALVALFWILTRQIVFGMSFYVLAGIILVAGGIIFALIRIIYGIWKYAPEALVFKKARREGIPVIETVDIGSNNAMFELGKKRKTDDIQFETTTSGIRIDPMLTAVGCEPKRHGGGLEIYGYAYENWLPQTVKNHLAFRAIENYKHANCPDLDFLTDIEFCTLLATPEHHLVHDLKMYVNKYFKSEKIKDPAGNEFIRWKRHRTEIDPETVEKDSNGNTIPGTGSLHVIEEELNFPDLVTRFAKIKNDIAVLPIHQGWYSGTEAFKNNSYSYAAQDLEQLLIIHDKMNFLDYLSRINFMQYGIVALIILIGGGIAFYIVTAALGGGKGG